MLTPEELVVALVERSEAAGIIDAGDRFVDKCTKSNLTKGAISCKNLCEPRIDGGCNEYVLRSYGTTLTLNQVKADACGLSVENVATISIKGSVRTDWVQNNNIDVNTLLAPLSQFFANGYKNLGCGSMGVPVPV